MRVLWLCNDRSNRVMDFWSPLRLELGKLCEVKTVMRRLDCLEVELCRTTTRTDDWPEPLLDPVEASEYDWILCDAMYSFPSEHWNAIEAKKGVFWGDCHGDMVRTYILKWALKAYQFDLFLPAFRDGQKHFLSQLPADRVRWCPHWIDPEVFKIYSQAPKAINMLQTGVIHDKVYPWRQRVYDALQDVAGYRRIQRPPERLDGPGWPTGVDYAQLLSEAKVSFACTSRYHYPISKIFEIPACWCLLFCDDTPELRDLGFAPEVNFVPYREDVDLREWILDWVSSDALREEVTENGHYLIHTEHTAQFRAGELHAILHQH